ncbi:MAG: LptF/LptG family permease [Planctomycetota bacterium]|nr:LptF/LptG family permease [Planctomycetota bacterium]
MSKTLFWYIFWNLLRVFTLTTGGLAVIMCLGGLLRPLTENGLDLGQVNRMVLYMLPAMCTYSLPVSALFASTMVYGRFSADNELTAMRAGGIGFISLRRFSIALPALVLGLLVAVISLLMLCFIVPIYTLKVEEVLYSNIAKVVASKIQKNHEVQFPDESSGRSLNIFAQAASLPRPEAGDASQRVLLVGPAMINFDEPLPGGADIKVPREFWMAKTATVSIERDPNPAASTSASLFVQLNDGIKFPRQFTGSVQAGVAATTFGPIQIPSPITENVKFMDVGHLAELAGDPGRSEKVKVIVRSLILREQERKYLNSIAGEINKSRDSNTPKMASYGFKLDDTGSDHITIGGANAAVGYSGSELVIDAPPVGDDARSVWLHQNHGSQETLSAKAKEIRIRAKPDPINLRMAVSIELYDTELHTQDVTSERLSYPVALSVPMPAEIQQVASKSLDDYRHDPHVTPTDAFNLRHEQVVVNNAVRSELHGRASFAVSCLILVMVGCALGAMFKSGNFLTAFAASFLPALLCITLIVCGQQIATHVPFDTNFHNPLSTSLWFIWAGNIVVLSAAIFLTGRLQRR